MMENDRITIEDNDPALVLLRQILLTHNVSMLRKEPRGTDISVNIIFTPKRRQRIKKGTKK